MPDDLVRQSIIDDEHLKLLSWGYMASAGVTAFFALFGLMYVFFGILMSVAFSHIPPSAIHPNDLPPTFIGWIFGGFGLVFFVVGATLAFLKLRTGLCIKRRRSKTFCQVIAAISCLEIPYGTLLGVATFMVLGRDSVAALFPRGRS